MGATGWLSSKGTPAFWVNTRKDTFQMSAPFYGSDFLTRINFNIKIGTYSALYGASNIIPTYTNSSVTAGDTPNILGGRTVHGVVYTLESSKYRVRIYLDGTADFTLGTIYMRFNGQQYKLSKRYGTWPGDGTSTNPARIAYIQEDTDLLTYDPFVNFNGYICPCILWYQ